MLRQGSTGEAVKAWQRFLIDQGFLPEGQADGAFGPKTHTASAMWQASQELVADGIIGPKSLLVARGQGYSSTMEIPPLVRRTAEELGISPDRMMAFQIVESGGRADSVRFEPHLAHRKLGERAEAIPWTRNERGAWSLVRHETSRAAFDRALAMHDDEPWRRAIIESASFGLFQVLGGGLIKLFGVDDAIENFTDDPEVISYALVAGWFKGNRSALAAARKVPPDIRTLVKRYNGNGPNVDNYVAKLTAALLRVRGF